MELCKTAAMKNIQKINRVMEVMWREIREMKAEKTVATASRTVNQTFSYKSGIEWR